MTEAIYTISTQSHLFKSFALRDSLAQYGYRLKIFVIDGDKVANDVILLSSVHSELIDEIKQKYQSKPDHLRWGLKSAIGIYLLDHGFDKIIYVDNDIFFFNSPEFLFQKLKQNNFLLTPHFYKDNPNDEQNWLEANYRIGLYNAGFFGANQHAKPILEWWAACCLYEMKKSYWRGLYDDQKYLDMIPVLFDEVKIVKNRGCNLAGWNNDSFLGKEEDIVFVHFAELTMERWMDKTHPLNPLYEKYLISLREYKSDYEWRKNRWSINYWKNAFYYIRWKLKGYRNCLFF